MLLSSLQSAVQQHGVDAWALYDFRGSNSIAWNILQLQPGAHCTRRWMVVIPAEGTPVKILPTMEQHPLDHIQAETITYSSKAEWEQAVVSVVGRYPTLAMEYSPNNELPVTSKVDGGTIEWLRSLGTTIVSSADIAQQFTAAWSREQFNENMQTASLLRATMMQAFRSIRAALLEDRTITEYDVQKEVLTEFERHGMITDFPPIVAVNAHAADPHYAPTEESHAIIQKGDLVLIDMWAKTEHPKSTFADITWMGYAGETVPERYSSLFSILCHARDAVIATVRKQLADGLPVRGCDLDDVARTLITEAGYGKNFFHRTGHNITTEIHGAGANLDNYETKDTRRILPMTSFSVEPGIYLPGDIGFRTEIDMVITEDGQGLVPTEPVQQEIIPLLAELMPVVLQ